MLERQSRDRLPDAPHTQLKAADGRLLYEHCITRQGFDGPYTIAYHEQRPHEAQPAVDAPVALPPAGTFPERLLRRHYQSPQSALALDSSRGEASRASLAAVPLRAPGVTLAMPRANDAELRQHEAMLDLIQKSSGGKAVWRAMNSTADAAESPSNSGQAHRNH